MEKFDPEAVMWPLSPVATPDFRNEIYFLLDINGDKVSPY